MRHSYTCTCIYHAPAFCVLVCCVVLLVSELGLSCIILCSLSSRRPPVWGGKNEKCGRPGLKYHVRYRVDVYRFQTFCEWLPRVHWRGCDLVPTIYVILYTCHAVWCTCICSQVYMWKSLTKCSGNNPRHLLLFLYTCMYVHNLM